MNFTVGSLMLKFSDKAIGAALYASAAALSLWAASMSPEAFNALQGGAEGLYERINQVFMLISLCMIPVLSFLLARSIQNKLRTGQIFRRRKICRPNLDEYNKIKREPSE